MGLIGSKGPNGGLTPEPPGLPCSPSSAATLATAVHTVWTAPATGFQSGFVEAGIYQKLNKATELEEPRFRSNLAYMYPVRVTCLVRPMSSPDRCARCRCGAQVHRLFA